MPIVLQKYIADAGICSRRKAETLITEGRVSVNGVIITKLGTRVDEHIDTVLVDTKAIKPTQRFVYYILHKPKGVISAVSDDRGRETVIDLIPTKERIVPIGRLDIDTAGLLLLTNDGDLVHQLTHPKFEHEKEYEIIVQTPQEWNEKGLENAIKRIEKGVTIANKFKTSPAKVRLMRAVSNDRFTLSITIHEGKKHQIRQMVDAVGLTVVDLRRVRMGPIMLGSLPIGAYRPLNKTELLQLQAL